MHPILIEIGNFPIHSYGVCIAAGFLLSILFVRWKAKKLKISVQKIVDLGFWSLLVGLIGARFFFVLSQFSEFIKNPKAVFFVWEGGLVFYGGPLFCIPFYFWYTKKFQLPRAKVLDVGAQALPLAHAFGRIGCFLAGCCFGKPTESWFGMTFPAGNLYPVQLYESALIFGIFIFLAWFDSRKRFDGQLAFLYLILYSVVRFFVEFFRGDSIRGFVVPELLSTSQFISILVLAFTLYFYRKRKLKYKK